MHKAIHKLIFTVYSYLELWCIRQCFEQNPISHSSIKDTIIKGHSIQSRRYTVSQGETAERSVCFLKCLCLNQQNTTICDNKYSVCLCNWRHMRGSTVKMMNNTRINYFSPIPPRENPHMEFSANELNSQMFQHLVDPFGICRGRIHHQGGDCTCSFPLFLFAQLGTSKV